MKRILHIIGCVLCIALVFLMRSKYGFEYADDAFIRFVGNNNRSLFEHFLTASAMVYLLSLMLSVGETNRSLKGMTKHLFLSHSVLICALGFSFAYSIGSCFFEYKQAYESVYGDVPRGYFQYDQWSMDIVGSLMACVLAWRFDIGRAMRFKKYK